MGMYHCTKEGCPGHDSFSAVCPANVSIQDYSTYQYPGLSTFQNMSEIKLMMQLPTQQTDPDVEKARISNGNIAKLKSKLNYKKPTKV